MEPQLQPKRITLEPVTTPETTPEQNIIQAYLELVPVNKEALEKAMSSNGFEAILNTVKSLSELELSQHLEEDLEQSYDDLNSERPKTIEELQQRFLIAQEHQEETMGPRDPLTANTLDYFNQRLTTITSLEEIVKEKPILLHLLKKEQQRLAHLLVSLEKLLPPTQEQAVEAAA